LVVLGCASLSSELIPTFETARVHIAGIIRLAVESRLWIEIPEDLCQVPVIFVLPFVTGLLQSNPGVLAPINQRGRIGIRREQVAKGRSSITLECGIEGFQEL
jgi:hypothetical protein